MVPKWGQTYGCIQNQPCPTHLCSLPTVQISKYINKKYNNIHHLSFKFFFLNERNKKIRKIRKSESSNKMLYLVLIGDI